MPPRASRLQSNSSEMVVESTNVVIPGCSMSACHGGNAWAREVSPSRITQIRVVGDRRMHFYFLFGMSIEKWMEAPNNQACLNIMKKLANDRVQNEHRAHAS